MSTTLHTVAIEDIVANMRREVRSLPKRVRNGMKYNDRTEGESRLLCAHVQAALEVLEEVRSLGSQSVLTRPRTVKVTLDIESTTQANA